MLYPALFVFSVVGLLINSGSLPASSEPRVKDAQLRGQYCMQQNIIPRQSSDLFSHDDITFVTQASLNHAPLLRRHARLWDGPISATFFIDSILKVPKTISLLQLLHGCDEAIARTTSIHIFYPPSSNGSCFWSPHIVADNCDRQSIEDADFVFSTLAKPSQTQPYPINIARNFARKGAITKYLLTADIELLPNPGFVDKVRPLLASELRNKTVLVVPSFEIAAGLSELPANKSALYALARKGKAFAFHHFRSGMCHQMPNMEKWWISGDGGQSRVFARVPWIRPCWEPIFVSQADVPYYDERFKGYGKNKIQQVYELCRDNYRFAILDNVFVVHEKISILSKEEWAKIRPAISRNNDIFQRFRRELDSKYPNARVRQYCDAIQTVLAL
uniref:Beta-1,4-glucuronyltransferase 1 n=1 Tax=Plectus sambesii TaxID=2011161 RepID=A0A914XV26_9BILA